MRTTYRLINMLLLMVIVALGVTLTRPGPRTTSFEFVLPIAPPLVRMEEATLGAYVDDEQAVLPEPSTDGEWNTRELNTALLELRRLSAQRDLLVGRRASLKLRIEAVAVDIGNALPPVLLAGIYRDRIDLTREYGELRDIERRRAMWTCADTSRPLSAMPESDAGR